MQPADEGYIQQDCQPLDFLVMKITKETKELGYENSFRPGNPELWPSANNISSRYQTEMQATVCGTRSSGHPPFLCPCGCIHGDISIKICHHKEN